MALKKLGHVVLKVRDLDRSEAFYTGVLGLTVTGRMPGRMVFFAVPGNSDSHDLGLWQVGPDAAPQVPRQVGLFHVAWQVEREEDLRAFHDSLAARGVPVVDDGPRCEPVRVLRGSGRAHARGHLREAARDVASGPQPVRRSRAASLPGRAALRPLAAETRMEPVLVALARLVAGTSEDAIPASVRDRAALIVADSVGAILGGAQEPEVRRLHAGAERAAGPATVLGEGFPRVEPWWAITANGLAGTMLELDEGNRFARGHPGIHVFPAALAEAERLGRRAARCSGLVMATTWRRGWAAGRRSGPGCTCTGSTGRWGRRQPSPGCASWTRTSPRMRSESPRA
jgi:catechol 2,3-dioxygenase-like lactoylglutathione lyase family enzyme